MALGSSLSWARLGIGLVQGLSLLWLYQKAVQEAWPATEGILFAPLVAVAIFIPTLLIASFGNIHPRVLVPWALGAVVLCAGVEAYDIVRESTRFGEQAGSMSHPRFAPSASAWLSLATILFIAQSLIAASETDRRAVATYPTYFDISWKHGVQLVLALLFVGVFWGILRLSAELFRLIGIEFLAQVITRATFWIPATALAFGYAIDATDTRTTIVRGARTLTLFLLSWLLPLMVLMVVAFLASLLFTGFQTLWQTKRAAAILLSASAVLVFLLNAAYQDGRTETRATAMLRYASVVGAIVVMPLVGLAAYALVERIGQYGLSPARIGALACVVVASCYGLGYGLAAIRSGTDLKGFARTNVVTALVVIAVLLVLSTPLADPARLSVVDQLRRLQAGRISPEQFDFTFLRFYAGRYGREALEQLVNNPQGSAGALIAQLADRALRATTPGALEASSAPQITPEQREANIVVIEPKGALLPEEFARQDWSSTTGNQRQLLSGCLVADVKCEAILADIDGDGRPEILLLEGRVTAFKSGADGWDYFGRVTHMSCVGVRDALRAGRFKIVEPSFKEIEVAGQRLGIDRGCIAEQGAR